MVLEFQPLQNKRGQVTKELFGPIQVKVILESELQTRVDNSSLNTKKASNTTQIRDRRVLFQQTHIAYDGTFQACAAERKHFPFTVFFPKRAVLTKTQKKEGFLDHDGSWIPPGEREDDLGEILPPTFKTTFSDSFGSGEAAVSYRLKAEVRISGIDLSISATGPNPVLLYRPPPALQEALRGSNMFEQSITVVGKDLIDLDDDEHPHGLREHLHHLLHHGPQPRYTFDILCTSTPENISAGQSFSFDVGVSTNRGLTTAHVEPEIMVDQCKITLLGYTRLHAFSHAQKSSQMKDTSEIAAVIGTASIEGAFSEFNDYTHTISNCPLPQYLPNSFAVEKLSRSYRIRISLDFLVGKQKVYARHEFPIKIHPPLPPGFTEYEAQAGRAQISEWGEEQPPPYEEATSS